MSAPHGRLRAFLVIATVLGCALGSFWWVETMRRDRDDSVAELPKGEPDYTIERFNLVRMAKNGRARYNISGAKLTHYPDNDSFEIERPVLYSIGNDKATMTMRAERAIVEHQTNRVHMHRRVMAERGAVNGSEPFRMATEYLLLLPDDDTVQTDKRVDIVSGHSHVSGIGMFANNATREFRLLKDVHATIAPPRR